MQKTYLQLLWLFWFVLVPAGANLGLTHEMVKENSGIKLVSYNLESQFYSLPRGRSEGLSEFNLIVSVPSGFGDFRCRVDWGGKNLAIEPQRLGEGRYRISMRGEPVSEVFIYVQCTAAGQSRVALIRAMPFSAKLE